MSLTKKASDIKNIYDLEEFLGKTKVNELFIEHYLTLVGKSIEDKKEIEIFVED